MLKRVLIKVNSIESSISLQNTGNSSKKQKIKEATIELILESTIYRLFKENYMIELYF